MTASRRRPITLNLLTPQASFPVLSSVAADLAREGRRPEDIDVALVDGLVRREFTLVARKAGREREKKKGSDGVSRHVLSHEKRPAPYPKMESLRRLPFLPRPAATRSHSPRPSLTSCSSHAQASSPFRTRPSSSSTTSPRTSPAHPPFRPSAHLHQHHLPRSSCMGSHRGISA